ncbi:MAG: family 78 glycoside hydrolase catalytic domain [Clostridia bacterium]|nr:family 78 glycoside hydrolase catalytic domain [Clostridia bacterium]
MMINNSKWIGAPRKYDKTVNVRKIFGADKKVEKAVLYSTARGFYEVYINGEKISDTFYNPGFTDYRKRIYYQSYDITDKIKKGENVIGATVTKGYYTGYVGYSGDHIYGEENTFLAALLIEFEGGERLVIHTDETWQFTDKGAVTDADYLQGETYDARMEIDWAAKSDIWEGCGIYEYPKYATPTNGTLDNEPFELCAEPENCGAVLERVLKPVKAAYEMPENHFVFDLGQNMVGTVKITMNGESGRTLKIRYGEMCYRDGRVYNKNFRTAKNTDIYTMKGGYEEFMPSFTSHGFRYIEISGENEPLTKKDFERMNITAEGLVLTNTPEVVGTFECSNKDINKLFENIMWGQRGNSLLVFTDCPQRNERMGWTGDAQVFAKTAAYNMNVKAFMEKWLTDLRDAQLMYNLSGAVPDTAPLGGDNRAHGGCVGWGDAAVIVPWEMYKAYGDTKFLSDNYEMMKKWVAYENSPERQTGFIQTNPVRGDHLAVDTSTPTMLCATAYAAYSAKLLAKTAEILGNDGDTKKYNKLFGDIKTAFNKKWVKQDGTIEYVPEKWDTKVTASQTSYALAIDFGLIDAEKMEGAKRGFKAALDEYHGKLSVGFLGISHLMNALTKAGMTEEAFALLEQTEYPSWLYSVRNGATTIWERWNSYIAETDTFGDERMNSFNHYAYGAVGEWMYGKILGINTSEKSDGVGYKKIILTPTVGGSLTYAKGSLKTKWGTVKSEWRIEDGKFKYKCTIPENTTALLYLGNKKIPLTSGSYEYVSEEL